MHLCAWGDASKNLVRRFDMQTAVDEIHYVGERSRALNWIICDANFGILERDIELARHIRQVRDAHGYPKTCHVWLAKNVTERNLEIGKILGDMVVPVMAVQSLDDEVLRNIKQSNISTETYVQYQRQFHRIGSTTYSDLIVPLPGETLKSHVAGLSKLFSHGVDEIACHNMRLLAGAEANSDETRETFGFRTRYRLIHGDAGIYGREVRAEIRSFEYEDPLRSTTSMTEEQMFYLRKLHVLVDCMWNSRLYRPLLRALALYGVNQVDVLRALLAVADGSSPVDIEADARADVRRFFAAFEQASRSEWFDSAEEIEVYFARPENFQRLLDQEFEKLNIQYSVVLLNRFKPSFDRVIADLCRSFDTVPHDVLEPVCAYAFAQFPGLDATGTERALFIPDNLDRLNDRTVGDFAPSTSLRRITFVEDERRAELRRLIVEARGRTLSRDPQHAAHHARLTTTEAVA